MANSRSWKKLDAARSLPSHALGDSLDQLASASRGYAPPPPGGGINRDLARHMQGGGNAIVRRREVDTVDDGRSHQQLKRSQPSVCSVTQQAQLPRQLLDVDALQPRWVLLPEPIRARPRSHSVFASIVSHRTYADKGEGEGTAS